MQAKKVAIIGGGLTGLCLGYYLNKLGIEYTIFEQDSKTGGVIQTKKELGFTFECGPNTGVLGNIEIEQLLKTCRVEIANETAKKRRILKNNTWHELPSGIMTGIMTPLFSFYDKCRLLGEPFRAKGTNPDETIRSFVERRLGKSFHDFAVAPFINGVYAGNTQELITRHALPKLYALEQSYGSFIRGAIAKAKNNKKNTNPQASKQVFSLEGGLETLISELSQISNLHTIVNAQNVKINPFHNQCSITWENDGVSHSEEFSHVVSTVHAKNFVAISSFLTVEEQQIFANTIYAPIVQVSVGFSQWQGCDIHAFGGLIPPSEHRDILGILFPSSMFTNRAPLNGALLSVFMGGQLRKDIIHKTDKEIEQIVQRELMDLLSIPSWNPQLLKIFRYPQAIAQYTLHIDALIQTKHDIEQRFPFLTIAGSMFDGIGMADRVKQAHTIAEKIRKV